MNQRSYNRVPILFTSLLYACGFFIFLEWLYPMKQITDTHDMKIFIIYAVFCFVLSLFQIKWWNSLLLKGLGMLFFINLLFFEGSLFDLSWIYAFIADVLYNVDVLISRDLYSLTAIFRSTLFLLLIWLMSYLIHYWFVIVKRVFLFIALTFIYLSVLDTFTVYNANVSIVRVFILSFLALGMTNFLKEVQIERIPFTWTKKSAKWFVPIISIVLLSALVGYGAPKLDPKWPDPVPFIQSAVGTGGGDETTIKKVGYGEDDSRLGGSFVQDDTRVFQAISEERHYWRIETKDIYTGKGWESFPVGQSITKEIYTHDNIPLHTFDKSVDTEERQAFIRMSERAEIPKLIYPYGLHGVNVPSADVQLNLDESEESIRTEYNGDETTLQEYGMTYDHPSFNVDNLKKPGEDPADLKEHYTQLPDNFPKRIQNLAEEITEPFDTRYEKVTAIEKYFGQSGEFTYQTEDIPVPKGNQDYVDQFLFDSKVGYCDNYSTSMVTMLRTLDIPARWAKGFTSGEIVPNDEVDVVVPDGRDVYEVTNANAHSWVEVYFPNTGWVPFEPTQGFSNLTDFHVEVDAGEEDDALDASEVEEPETDEEEELSEEEEDDSEETSAGTKKDNDNQLFTFKTWHLYLGIGLLLLLGFFIYWKRFQLEAYILGKKMNNNDAASYQAAYQFLLKLLKHKGDGKDPQQTLREYAKEIDVLYTTKTMSLLTFDYEQLIYNKKEKSITNKEFPQLWKDLVNRIMG